MCLSGYAANAEVRSLNMTRWFGGGVLHTKLWVVDGAHFYVGSANMDWRSLTQVHDTTGQESLKSCRQTVYSGSSQVRPPIGLPDGGLISGVQLHVKVSFGTVL